MMTRTLFSFHTSKFNVKKIAFRLLHYLKGINEERDVAPNLVRVDPREMLLL